MDEFYDYENMRVHDCTRDACSRRGRAVASTAVPRDTPVLHMSPVYLVMSYEQAALRLALASASNARDPHEQNGEE